MAKRKRAIRLVVLPEKSSDDVLLYLAVSSVVDGNFHSGGSHATAVPQLGGMPFSAQLRAMRGAAWISISSMGSPSNKLASVVAIVLTLWRMRTRSCAVSPMRVSVSVDASNRARMASTNASTSPAGTSQPCPPEPTNSGMPAMKVLMIGLRSAIASIITTGRPSAKLGCTSARAAEISSRTCRSSTQPVMRTVADSL